MSTKPALLASQVALQSTHHGEPVPAGHFEDPLTAKRKREAFINAAFTREQQQAIGMILERWWSQKMAGIDTQKVIEATVDMPRQIAELREKLRILTGL